MADSAAPVPVLIVGPVKPRATGGIAACVRTLLQYRYDDRFRMRVLDTSKDPARQRSSWGKLFGSAVAVSAIVPHLLAVRGAVTHLHTSYGTAFFEKAFLAFVARMRGHVVVMHIHGSKFEEFYRGAPGAVRRFVRFVLETVCHRVIVLSDAWAGFFRDVVGVPAEKLFVLHNPVAVPVLQDVAMNPVDGQASQERPFRVLLLGSYAPGEEARKGIYEFLEAAQAVRADEGWRFMLAGPFRGGAAVRDAYLHQIREAGAEAVLEVVGPVYGDDKFRLIRSSDVVVLPSYAEGLPIVMMEAMALGVPVVLTPVGGVPDVVTHEANGLLIPVGDAPALVEALVRLRRDPDLRARLGRAGRRTFEERFALDRVGGRLNEFYLSLLPEID